MLKNLKCFVNTILSLFMIISCLQLSFIHAEEEYEEVIINNSRIGEGVNQFQFTSHWQADEDLPDRYIGSDCRWVISDYFDNQEVSFSLKFNGEKVSLYGNKTVDGGISDVYIDGEKVGQIDYYNSSRIEKTLLFESEMLSRGDHTIKVVVTRTSNTSSTIYEASIDYATVLSRDFKQIVVNDDNLGTGINQFNFTNGWVHEGGYPEYFEGGDEHWITNSQANTTSTSFTFRFIGNYIELYGHQTYEGCKADVYIDGEKVGVIDYYRSKRQNKVLLFASDNLANGEHTIKVVLNGERNPSSGYTYEAALDYALVECVDTNYSVESIEFTKDHITLEAGGFCQLETTITPSYANNVPNKIYTSSDENIATVDENGMLVAKSVGTCEISVLLEGTEITDTLIVEVKECLEELSAVVSDNNKHAYSDEYDVFMNSVEDTGTQDARSFKGTVWRKDEINSRIDIYTKYKAYQNATLITNDLVNENGDVISKNQIEFTYMDEAISYTNDRLIFDIITHNTKKSLETSKMYAAWVNIKVPEEAKPGIYTTKLQLKNDDQVLAEFDYEIEVLDIVQPNLTSQVELWMYPYSSNRYYSGKSSREYFGSSVQDLYYVHLDEKYDEGLKSQLALYKEMGGDAITVTVVEDPWNSQTHDPYPSMVKWKLKADGTWEFDYTDLDKWVNMNLDAGINGQIKTYSMSCWGNRITYYDEAQGKVVYERPSTGSERWVELWSTFFLDYMDHMTDKGWFDMTYMSMDERPLSEVVPVLDLVENTKNRDGKQMKTSIAVYQYEIESVMPRFTDLSLALPMIYESQGQNIIQGRKESGLMTTTYTCGAQNSAMLNNPQESVGSMYDSYKYGTDGFLRWALDSFNADPLVSSQHTQFAAGDLYLIYPDQRDGKMQAQTTPRYEKLLEGARDIEKLSYLKNNYEWLAEKVDEVTNKLSYNIPRSQNLIHGLAKKAINGPVEPEIKVKEQNVTMENGTTYALEVELSPDTLLDELEETVYINDFDEDIINYVGDWNTDEGYPDLFYNGDDHWVGAYNSEEAKSVGYDFDFVGYGFKIIGNYESVSGELAITIDDQEPIYVDPYSDGKLRFQTIFETYDLDYGEHHVSVRGSGNRHHNAQAYNMQLDYIEVYKKPEIVYASDNESVVSVDTNGTLQAHDTGKANVTIQLADLSTEVAVNVIADKSELTEQLTLALEILEKEENYTVESFNVFKQAYEQAKTCKELETATQTEVDAAKVALETAAAALVEKPVEPELTAPAKVENVKAEDTNYKTITLTWDASETATAYDVYRKAYDSEEFKLYKTVEDTTVAVTGVMTGKEYTFYVVAKNEAGAAEASETVAKATTLHGKVTLDIEQVSTSTFKLSWNKIDGATRYIVYRKRNDDKMKKVLTLGADKLEYTTAEMPNGDYQFVLKAGRYDSTDRVMTKASNTVEGSVEKVKPAVTLKAGTKSVTVSWKKVEGVTHYQVYRATSEDGKYTKLTTTKELSYTAKSLKSGQEYFFKVRGYKTYKSGTDIQYTVFTPYSKVKSTKAK